MSESGFAQLIPLILIFVIFYFFLIRPQQKKVKEHKLMVENLKRGDKVITSGGIIGTVERIIDGDKAEISITDNVKVEVIKSTGIQALINNTDQKKIILSVIFFKTEDHFDSTIHSFYGDGFIIKFFRFRFR